MCVLFSRLLFKEATDQKLYLVVHCPNTIIKIIASTMMMTNVVLKMAFNEILMRKRNRMRSDSVL